MRAEPIVARGRTEAGNDDAGLARSREPESPKPRARSLSQSPTAHHPSPIAHCPLPARRPPAAPEFRFSSFGERGWSAHVSVQSITQPSEFRHGASVGRSVPSISPGSPVVTYRCGSHADVLKFRSRSNFAYFALRALCLCLYKLQLAPLLSAFSCHSFVRHGPARHLLANRCGGALYCSLCPICHPTLPRPAAFYFGKWLQTAPAVLPASRSSLRHRSNAKEDSQCEGA